MDRGHAPIEYSSPCHPAFPPTADIFASWPPTYLLFGDSEVLCEDGWEMDRRMRLAGVDVTTVCERDGVHDMLACTWYAFVSVSNILAVCGLCLHLNTAKGSLPKNDTRPFGPRSRNGSIPKRLPAKID